MTWLLGALLSGVAALIFAAWLAYSVRKEDPGNSKMQSLSQAIYEGAMAYLNRQYKTLVPLTLALFGLLLYLGSEALAVAFLTGAVASAIAGYLGMLSTTRSNCRTTEAARSSLGDALSVAFRAGSVMGLSVAGLALTGVAALYLIYGEPLVINSFAFGASVIAFFARVGGGIYTKAADVGADLVGKVEAGIPEDDPRNPAVIADNVGDNVGDTAGMGADLFESYGATLIASMIIGHSFFGLAGALLPLMLGAAGIVSAIGAVLVMHWVRRFQPQEGLNTALWFTTGMTAIFAYILCDYFFPLQGLPFFLAVLLGLAVNVLLGIITEYFTSSAYEPTRRIAEASTMGAATNIMAGLAVGFKSTAPTLIVFVVAILGAHTLAGLYGLALAAMGMLSTAAIVVAIDSFGPVADNAGGIAEMAGLDPEVRQRTDQLDAVGNTTAAIAKGFAIGSAALTALALFAAFTEEAAKNPALHHLLVQGKLVFNLTEPTVLIGILLGAALPFFICALTIEAVGRAAFKMIEEVRRQFREIPGLMTGSGRPEYGRCVDISTQAALKEMVLPGVLAVAAPILVGFILGVKALAGFLAGLTAAGVLLALFMANAGGAWDNAKKYIESGLLGGKGSKAHEAAVIGDTIGDPFKDTAGPAMNPLIKVAGTISLILGPLLFF